MAQNAKPVQLDLHSPQFQERWVDLEGDVQERAIAAFEKKSLNSLGMPFIKTRGCAGKGFKVSLPHQAWILCIPFVLAKLFEALLTAMGTSCESY